MSTVDQIFMCAQKSLDKRTFQTKKFILGIQLYMFCTASYMFDYVRKNVFLVNLHVRVLSGKMYGFHFWTKINIWIDNLLI